MRLFIALFFSLILSLPTLASEEKYSESDLLDRPLMERYILDELKSLRQDYQSLEKRMITEITDRELTVADKSLNYANVTVTYFFYIIAGVASLIAFVGCSRCASLSTTQKKWRTSDWKKSLKNMKRNLLRWNEI